MENENKIPNPPAYPEIESVYHDGGSVETRTVNGTGLTMLDYFAGLAIPKCEGSPKNIAKEAYSLAYEMLNERMKWL